MEPVKYLYSKGNGIYFTMVPLFAIGVVTVPVFDGNDGPFNLTYVLILDLIALLILIYHAYNYLLPAFQNKKALEIDPSGIKYYRKNVILEWENIKEIKLVQGKPSQIIYITFKEEMDIGNYIRIPLTFVKGKDDDIYNTVLTYFKESNNKLGHTPFHQTSL